MTDWQTHEEENNHNAGRERTRLSRQILKSCRNELYALYPSLDGAFAAVDYRPHRNRSSIATDGRSFYFSPEFVTDQYAKSPAFLCRGYLHMLIHCLFGHIFPEEKFERRIWDLACDMAAERIVEREAGKEGAWCLSLIAGSGGKESGTHAPEGNRKERTEVRNRCFELMGRDKSPWQIGGLLGEGFFPFSLEEMEGAFSFDDHTLWYSREREDGGSGELKSFWEKIRSRAGGQGAAFGSQAGSQEGTGEEKPDEIYRSRYDYRCFLQRFARRREELQLDGESFDYIYYTLGMERYGSLPLIEPLEYREVNRLEELVIAIDTSGSCTARTVGRFLGETWAILSQKENFFERMQVWIIQCDCCVQDVAVIHSREEWEEYARNVAICGRAGTDFRPVFDFIEKQRRSGELQKLAALIYFTDGEGVYPTEKPDYEAAFVFVKKTKGMETVPSWGLRLLAECRETG